MEFTFVARQVDGLILVETWDDLSNERLTPLKAQAKQLLKTLQSAPRQCSIDSNGFVFHYVIHDGIVFLVLCSQSYPAKLAHAFLLEIHNAFQEELKREYGTSYGVDYRSLVDTIEKPYYFIKFDSVIQTKKKDFKDPSSSKALQKLNESLSDVSNIMKQNIDDMLRRGENLQEVGRKAEDLKYASHDLKKTTKMLSFQALLRKYGVVGVIVLFVILFVYLRFF